MDNNGLITSIKTPQFFYEIHTSERFQGLCRIIDANLDKSVLVFCRTKKDVDFITEKLNLLNYKAGGYHGDIGPHARDITLKKFIAKELTILLVTDIPNKIDKATQIETVVFSMIPQDPDSYTQRIQRLESSVKMNEISILITGNEFKKIAFIKRITKTDITQKNFSDVAEILTLKKEILVKEIESTTVENKDIQDFGDSLLKQFDAKDLVYHLIEKGFHDQFNPSKYKQFKQKEKKSKTQDSQERLFIALGKTDNITDDILIEFLHKETNIEKEHFSEIKIFDTFSFFAIPAQDAEIILEIFRRKKRGKRSIVERAKGKDAIKKK
jgi:ATP-dependent RNA helicase DeaD